MGKEQEGAQGSVPITELQALLVVAHELRDRFYWENGGGFRVGQETFPVENFEGMIYLRGIRRGFELAMGINRDRVDLCEFGTVNFQALLDQGGNK